jgi:beta-glucosidase
MATRIVATWYQLGQDSGYPPPNFSSNTRDRIGPLYPGALFSPSGVVNEYVNVQSDHYKIVREIGRDAITMLKNDDHTLPLSTNAKIRIFGSDAGSNPRGPNACENRACNIGVLG